ncbi:hypothetical protein RhiirC2_770303 [Rhizophagus irregularis]|uniref:Uncharacterized protein n=1 Tax=Rhizophagus irregularis TaxID=588596 RepID=A0A2N1NWP9_9GLOM|nr:hypothetical protein RhiirC2_770303 [Rhizophagus irregularis]
MAFNNPGFIVTENSEVLSFEDIFFLDIDDIYPFTYSTLHYEEPESDDTYEINNYFDDMLKDALAAPISIKQVIPQHSTTPLTLIDTDVTPPPSTSKFFLQVNTADFENINLGYDDKNDFSNLPLTSPIHSQVSTEIKTPKKDKIPSPGTILPSSNPLVRPSSAVNNSLPRGKNNPLKISFSKFHVTLPRRSGYNRIYEIRRSRSFFFELDDHPQNTNDIHLKIHTNDYHMKTKPISYNNTSTIPNAKYQISCMLTHFFSSQRVIPRRIQQKYFYFIRDKLLARQMMILSRANSDKE